MLSPVSLSLLLSLGLAPVAAAQESLAAPTYHQDVAPILRQHCIECHRPGQVAPFSLLTYEDAQRRARLIASKTEDRFMPPWHPVEGHGEFAGERRLSERELATLARWASEGRLEGDPDPSVPTPEFSSEWYLGPPDLIVTMPESYTVPAGGPDIYRSFSVPLGTTKDRWLRAIEVRPKSRSVVHHIVFALDPSHRMRALSGLDGQPGFDGMKGGGGALGRSTAGLGGWAVGAVPRELPMGLAKLLPAGTDLVLRTHFHPSGKPEVEQTTLGLYFSDKPSSRSMVELQLPPGFGIASGLEIPAGEANYRLRDWITLPVDTKLITIGGHAHYIARELHMWVTPPKGERRSLFYIDQWAFNWQSRYQYATPVDLPAGTLVEVELVYDNSGENPSNPFDPPRPIGWGLDSLDEMGSITLLLVPERESDAAQLRESIQAHAAECYVGIYIAQLRAADADGDGRLEAAEIPAHLEPHARSFDGNGDGLLEADELRAAMERFYARTRERVGVFE